MTANMSMTQLQEELAKFLEDFGSLKSLDNLIVGSTSNTPPTDSRVNSSASSSPPIVVPPPVTSRRSVYDNVPDPDAALDLNQNSSTLNPVKQPPPTIPVTSNSLPRHLGRPFTIPKPPTNTPVIGPKPPYVHQIPRVLVTNVSDPQPPDRPPRAPGRPPPSPSPSATESDTRLDPISTSVVTLPRRSPSPNPERVPLTFDPAQHHHHYCPARCCSACAHESRVPPYCTLVSHHTRCPACCGHAPSTSTAAPPCLRNTRRPLAVDCMDCGGGSSSGSGHGSPRRTSSARDSPCRHSPSSCKCRVRFSIDDDNNNDDRLTMRNPSPGLWASSARVVPLKIDSPPTKRKKSRTRHILLIIAAVIIMLSILGIVVAVTCASILSVLQDDVKEATTGCPYQMYKAKLIAAWPYPYPCSSQMNETLSNRATFEFIRASKYYEGMLDEILRRGSSKQAFDYSKVDSIKCTFEEDSVSLVFRIFWRSSKSVPLRQNVLQDMLNIVKEEKYNVSTHSIVVEGIRLPKD